MKLRNVTDQTVLDFLTQQVAGPDEVITVDDDLAEHYEGHTTWEVLPDVAVGAVTPTPQPEQGA